MNAKLDDPIRDDVERVLRRIVDVAVVAPWTIATWGPRCVLKRLGTFAGSAIPATAVQTVIDLAQQTTSPSESTLDGFVTADAAAPSGAARAARRNDAPGDAPAVGELPIEDYESLAASQVVTRLEALSADGLRTVRDFEVAHRGRRTILGKIDQLLS